MILLATTSNTAVHPPVTASLTDSLVNKLNQHGKPVAGGQNAPWNQTGDMYVVDQKETNITAGLDLRMPHADQIRFLMVSGTIAIGDRRA